MAGGNSRPSGAPQDAPSPTDRRTAPRTGDVVTGRAWVARPFLRWSIFGASFLLFGAFFGIVALNGQEAAGSGQAYLAIYLTDAAEDDLEALPVELDRVCVGARGSGGCLDLIVDRFDLMAHRGPENPLLVAHGYVDPAQRELVSIQFASVSAVVAGREVPVELTEPLLNLEFDTDALAEEGAHVLFHVDLKESVDAVVDPAGEPQFTFAPTVTEVFEVTAPALSGSEAKSFDPERAPSFLTASAVPPVKQYRAVPIAPTVMGATSASYPPTSDGLLVVSPRPSVAGSSGTTSSPPGTSSSASPSGANLLPDVPASPTPFSGATGQATSGTLTWQGGDPNGEDVKFYVYFGTSSTPSEAGAYCIVDMGAPGASRACPYSGTAGTTYHWKVKADDRHGGITTSPVWSFEVQGSGSTPTTPTSHGCFTKICPV